MYMKSLTGHTILKDHKLTKNKKKSFTAFKKRLNSESY